MFVSDTSNDEPITWVILVMEHMPMDLRTLLQHGAEMSLSEKHVITLLFNMLNAVDFLHSTNLMHRDIKPSNFLVDDNCCVRLCDFGSTRPCLPNALDGSLYRKKF